MLRFGLATLIALLPINAYAFQSIYLVRHAEKSDGGKDPELSPVGISRAETLSRMLRDTNIKAVFSTEFKRTKMTAAKTADALKLTVQASNDQEKLIKTLKEDKSSDSALVVGHSNSIPEIIKALGSEAKIEIAETEFDNLFILSPQKEGKALLQRLRY